MAKSIQHSLFISHSPEIVWEYLTTSELMAQWLMPNDFLPILGHDFEFRTNPLPNFGFDGIVYCKVLEIVPYKKLTYSWKGGPGDGRITLDSIVEWTLAAKDNGTELSLDHSGFKEMEVEGYSSFYPIMDEGWFKIVRKIAELINAAKHGSTVA